MEGGFSPAAVPSYELPQGILVKGFLMLFLTGSLGQSFRRSHLEGKHSERGGCEVVSSVSQPRPIKEYCLLRLCSWPQRFPSILGSLFLPCLVGSHEVAPKHSRKGSASSQLWNPTCSQSLCPGIDLPPQACAVTSPSDLWGKIPPSDLWTVTTSSQAWTMLLHSGLLEVTLNSQA